MTISGSFLSQNNINIIIIDIKSALRGVCLRSGSPVVNERSLGSSFIHAAWVTSQPSVSEGGTTPRKGGGGRLGWVRWNRLTSPSVWGGMKNKCHGGWQRASVSYQHGQREWWLLSGPCAPRLFIILRWQGGAGKGERTGSPFVIHHSGGLLPLLSDCNMDKCGTCLQMPAHLNEQLAQKMIPLLFLLVQVSLGEGWKKKKNAPHHLCTPDRHANRQTYMQHTWYCEK